MMLTAISSGVRACTSRPTGDLISLMRSMGMPLRTKSSYMRTVLRLLPSSPT